MTAEIPNKGEIETVKAISSIQAQSPVEGWGHPHISKFLSTKRLITEFQSDLLIIVKTWKNRKQLWVDPGIVLFYQLTMKEPRKKIFRLNIPTKRHHCWNTVQAQSHMRRILNAHENTPGKQGKSLVISVSTQHRVSLECVFMLLPGVMDRSELISLQLVTVICLYAMCSMSW